MTAIDQPTENARRVYLAMGRLFTRYRDDRLKLSNVQVYTEAGIAPEELIAAQLLLVSAGLLAIQHRAGKSTYVKPGSLHHRSST
jgi:hypothetical protein